MSISNHQRGFSLVEVMVALVISLFLMGGVIQVYYGNKSSYSFSEGLSRIQENSRFAMDFIKRDLRMAGFRGCASSNFVNNLDENGTGYSAAQHDFFDNPAVQGVDANGLNASDSITIRGTSTQQANIVSPYNLPRSAQIFLSADMVQAGDIVMLSNCRGADIFQVTSTAPATGAAVLSVQHTAASGNPGNTNLEPCAGANAHCLSQTYGADSALLKMQTVVYEIDTGASGEPALFRSEYNQKEELVDGIEQMQILYGLNTDTDPAPNRYVDANNVNVGTTDWGDVTAVRIMLLARTDDNISMDGPQKYQFNDQQISSNDRRLRQVFSTTIALRNR